MEAREIHLFSRIEREHFFWRSRRDIVKHWLAKVFHGQKQKPLVIDTGTGTGIMVQELGDSYEAFGSDIFYESGTSLPVNRLVRADATALPFPDNTADAAISLDLLEHLPDDLAGIRELARITKPGGYIFVNVPAFALLWSDWDEAMSHKRRYLKSEIEAMAQKAGLKIIFARYVNSLPFLPILIYRMLRTKFGIGKGRRLEDQLPPGWINRIFVRAFFIQGTRKWINFPFGVSIFAVFRKI